MKTNRFLIFFLFLFFALFSLPPEVCAERLRIKIGAYENPPKIFQDDNGQIAGFWPELISDIAEKENWSIEYVWGSWSEGLAHLKTGKIDIMPDVAISNRRKKLYIFSKQPVLLSWSRYYVNQNTPNFESIFDLSHKKIAVLKNSINYIGPGGIRDLVQKFDIDCTFIEFKNYTAVFNAVKKNQADGGITNRNHGDKNATRFNLKRTPLLFQPISINFAFPQQAKLTPLLRATIDRNLKSLKNDSTSSYYKLLEKYFETEIAEKKIFVFPFWGKQLLFLLGVTLFVSILTIVIFRIKLRNSTNRYQRLTDNAQETIFRISLTEGCFKYISPAAVKLFGHAPAKFYASPELIKQAIHPDWQQYFEKQWDALINGDIAESYEYQIIHKSGEVRWVQQSSVLIRNNNGQPVAVEGILSDITQRKQAEKKLQEANTIINRSPAAAFLWRNEEGWPVEFVSENIKKILGYSAQEFMQKKVSYREIIHGDDLERVTEEVTRYSQKKDIQSFTHKPYRLVTKKGQTKWLNDTTYIRRNVQGEITHYEGVVYDITDLKQGEEDRARLEKQLLHTQKLKSLGVLAGGIAHDFNNILMAIIGNTELALRRLKAESPAIDNLHNVEQSAARAADLAKQMLAYSGKGKFVIESLDLNSLTEEMFHMLEVSISKKAILRLNPYNPLPSIKADATQMRQVIMNLVINASEAIGDKSGTITITTGCVNCDQNYLKNIWLDENLHEGLYVYLEINDTGCGMSKETLDKLFDPFFTTKFTGRGLGMAAVLGIVRGHKGAIRVYSEQKKGTTFKILFPAAGKLAGLFHKEATNDDWQGSGTVLQADDEEAVRELGAEMLKILGFHALTASDGHEAVELFKANPAIRCVILDLTMPRMDGEQCFRELKQLDPEVKVIMSSGYNEQEVTQRFTGKGLAGFIQKPYKLSVLRKAIRGAIQS